MASLYFKYGSMNCGKSALLIQSAFNYNEKKQDVYVMTASIDNRYGVGKVTTRSGGQIDSNLFNNETNLFEYISNVITERSKQQLPELACILIDEAQFLTRENVWNLAKVAKILNVPVICYGLRTDAFGESFEGSRVLLGIADHLEEIKTICHCGKKATMTIRIDELGNALKEGGQVMIGGNDKYESVCLNHYLLATAKI